MVIWNLIRRCNLNCRHCYSISADTDFPGELSTAEVFADAELIERAGLALPPLARALGGLVRHPALASVARLSDLPGGAP